MEQLVNQSLDRYQILTLLGEGGMGAVFTARDVTLQRDVAIKVMHPHFARQPMFQERFLQEARTAARLSHPCIVQVYDFGQSRGLLYIVMKLIGGTNLENMLQSLKQQKKWITLPESIQLIRQVAQALDYAHHQGVLHRDIKPANIMIEPDNSGEFPYRPILTDLGLAKLAEGGIVTTDGTSMGTPAYMSPEQALGQPTDARSDVYSLGILLFELSVGQRPFPAKSITEAIQYHTKTAPPRPTSIRPDLPKELENVILKAVEKDPAARFQSAADMAKALEGALSPATQVVTGPTAMESAVSLMTQYQEGPVEARGPSVFAGVSPAAGTGKDRIQVVFTDKTSRTIPLNKPSITIGRDQDNDIPVNDVKSSRHHVRIDFDGSNYKILDLNSTNGTYLDNARLLPGIGEIWTPEKLLRVGDTYFRLIRGQAVAGSAVYRTDGTQVDPRQVLSSPGEGRVGLFIENPSQPMQPGQPFPLSLTLLNQGQVVDHFKIAVEGLPNTWLPTLPPVVQLMPGAQQQLTLTLQPPHNAATRAGRYPSVVRVSSQDNPNQTAEAHLTLTLSPYTQFSTELFPQKVRVGKPARLTVKNLGNMLETYHIDWSDRADELVFTPQKLQLRVPEGQSAVAEFQAKPRQRRWFGGEMIHPFSTRVAGAQGEPQIQTGELVSRGLIPVWAIPAAMALCLILFMLGSAVVVGINNQHAQATGTAISAETLVAGIVIGTSQAGTAVAAEMANANAATQQAATQQAMVQGTADTASTQSAAVIMTATAAALESQNSATSTALAQAAAATATAQAQAEAATATAQAQLNATATANAALALTASAQAKTIDFFTKPWVNTDTATGGMTRLVIQKIDDSHVSFHGYGRCHPTDCDWNTITVPVTSSTLSGTYDFGFKTTQITVTKADDSHISVVTVDKNNSPATQTTSNYTFETEESRNKAISQFTGTWINNDLSNMPKLEIAKADDFTLKLHGYGACTPTYCDWGETLAPFTPPTIQGMWSFSFKTTSISITRSGDLLSVTTVDHYTDGRGPDKTNNYTFHK